MNHIPDCKMILGKRHPACPRCKILEKYDPQELWSLQRRIHEGMQAMIKQMNGTYND